jgi:hypothetical protein
MRLIEDGKIPPEVVTEYEKNAGVEPHKNEKIKGSRLMRAIALKHANKSSTAQLKRKRRRASTDASAIDFVLQSGMSEESFRAVLESCPRKAGEHHGIEYLAARGRKRRKSMRGDAPRLGIDELTIEITGNFSGLPQGDHLMVVRIQEDDSEMARCAVLNVSHDSLDRVLRAHASSKSAETDPSL